jgi:hypothetical protein
VRPRGEPLLGLTAIAVLLIGCAAAAVPPVSVDNLTDVPIAFWVDGVLSETLEPGTATDLPLPTTGKPPFAIEARTPSGTSIATFTISAEQYAAGSSGGPGSDTTMSFPCGSIRLVVGKPSAAQPQASPDLTPGPCP